MVAGIAGPGWRDAAQRELERVHRFGAVLVTLQDPGYPQLLRASSDPPPVLYALGRIELEDLLAVAIVGSRRATPHGGETARRIAGDLALRGFTVVSGLARGIDAAAHRGALESGGRTIAVLGSGLDRIYPAEHQKLAERIAGSGAVLSEFPFGAPPLKHHFPQRNRVIAWTSWSTVVVEAARDSGSLITAGLAADEGRLVHAVPGPVGAVGSEGTNKLLREGAILCRGAADVIEDLAPQVSRAAADRAAGPRQSPGAAPDVGSATGESTGPLSEAQKAVLIRMRRFGRSGGIGVDRLAEECGIAPGPLLAILLELEILGLIRQLPGCYFTVSGCKI